MIWKGGCLVSLILYDTKSGKMALRTHDLCQITNCSLADACKSFINEDLKGKFPHLYINNRFFADSNILNTTVDLKPEDYPKKDRASLKDADLKNFNLLENLCKYAKNDTEILVNLYQAINAKIYLPIIKADVLHFITMGSTTNYMFMLNLPQECYYKLRDDNGHTGRAGTEIKTKLYRCDMKENEMCRQSIYGGRCLPRQREFRTKNKTIEYSKIDDYLVYLDISGMYVSIMLNEMFPYDEGNYATNKELDKYNKLIIEGKNILEYLPKFYIAEVDIQPNPNDLEPPIGRHENGKLIWDCSRRSGWYNSIDVANTLESRGTLYKIEKMYYWKKEAKVFETWMKKTLEIKQEGDRLNKIEAGSGDAMRSFGKTSGNATYGQMLKKDHNDVIEFINNIADKDKFMNDNVLKQLILNQDDPEGLHIFIGERILDINKQLTSRSVFLGSFILSYTRRLLNKIFNCIYGDDRYRQEGITKQIYYGDTDSLLVHCTQINKLIKGGFIGNENGKLTDDLNKNFVKPDGSFEFAKVIAYFGQAPKSYGYKYVSPNNSIHEKVKIKGINQKDCEFINPLTQELSENLTYDAVYSMFINSEQQTTIKMNNRLKKTKCTLSSTEKNEGKKPFSVHSGELVRTMFKNEWQGRKLIDNAYVPLNSAYAN